MKLKQFIFALVAMLLSFSSYAFAQQTVVVNSFEELKAEIEKQGGVARSNSLRTRGVADQGDLSEFYGDIQLGNDIVMSEALVISNLRELTLDLNGHTISGDADKFIRNFGGFTVRDNSSAKSGGISCAIFNGDDQNDGAYLKIEGGTFKNKNAGAVVVTNYAVCEVTGGRFFSEGIALVNHASMTIDGGSPNNVYIEGKTHYITNVGTLAVNNATIAGAKDAYVGNQSDFGANVIFYNVAVNGKGYNSLSEAVANAEDGDLIRLFGNIEESAEVTINKVVTLDGNGKKLTSSSANNAIQVNAPSGTVTITNITIEGAAAYALDATTAVEVLASKLSAGGALKATNNKVFVQNSDLLGTGKMNVISVAEKVTLNFEGGSIESAAQTGDEDFFIIGGDCSGATFSIMTTDIELGGAENYLNLNTEANTVKVHSSFETAFNDKGYATDKKGNFMYVYNAVARVNSKNYTTLAAALDAATDASTVELLWEDYKAPIAMNGTVAGGKTVTITGTAKVDWDKGFLFVGRNAEGNGKVIFDNANLTSISNSKAYGFNVSGSKLNDNKTNDGTVEINNSTIELDYMINKGTMLLDNSTLTVKNGFSVTGRVASESATGLDATATMTLRHGSKVVVNNINGMGIGYEAYGVMDIDATSTFEATQSFLVGAKGTMNLAGTATIADALTNNGQVNVTGTANLAALTNNGQVNVAGGTVKVASGKTLANAGTVYVTGNATIDAKVTGEGWFYMNGVNLNAATKLDGAKVAFINGTNNVAGSTIKNGFFSVGVGKDAEAEKAAAFATANALTLGNVVVNVSGNATIGGNGASYSGWVGSAYSADKTQHTYTLNVNNSQAAFGYMHVSKDGTLNVYGRTIDGNKYNQDGAVVDFYAGELIVNGNVTLNNVDAWAKFTKMSVDHVGGILNINGDTKFESSIHNGSNTSTSLKFWNAGEFNVAKDATVEVDNGTVLVDGAKLNISGNVTAKGAVTGNGAITLKDATAVYTAPANLAVVTDLENKMVIYKEGAYKVYDPAAKIGDVFYLTLQEAIDAAVNGDVITFVNDVKENVTVAQTPDVKFTIDGAQKAMTGVITIDGKSSGYPTAGVTIQNVKFDATNIATDACINLGVKGNNNTRYTNNVTVKDCSFTGGNKEKVAIKSYTGGDKNLTVTGCTVDETMHSLIQAVNITGVVVDDCTVKSKNGINLNSSSNVEIKNSTIEVNGYAVRAGVSGGTSGDIELTNNTLKTDNSEGDAVIVIRGTAAEQINLSMSQNVVSGTTHISGTTAKTQVSADANYWDGEAYPKVSGTEVKVNNYYSDAAKSTLVKNNFGGSIVGYVNENRIWGDAWGNAFDSYVVKVLDANGDLMGTTSLNNVNNIIDGTVNVTWGINFVGDSTDPYWTWQWTTRPSITKMPAKVQLWIDGEMVNEGPVQFNAPDNLNKIVAATTDADGNLITCQTSLEKAVQAGNTVAILVPGTYNVPTGKDLTITGAVDGVEFGPIAEPNMGMKNYTFNNVTFNYANDSHYKGLQYAGEMVYNNCTFNGQVFLYGQSETFNNCTFNQTSAATYNVWTYSAKEVQFNECTFNSAGKSVLIYHEGATVFNNVAVTKSTFNASQAVAGKAAIEMDSQFSAGINLTIDGETTATGFDNGNVSGNSLWNNKVGDGTNANANNDITVIVNGDTVLQPTYQAQIGETKYKYFADAVKEVKNGETVTLLEDYVGDITFTQTKEVSFVLDGNHKTYNGSINITARAGNDATSTLVIKNFNFKTDKTSHDFIKSVETNYYPNNITISDCTFEGTSYANTADYAVVAVRLISANNIKIENCTGTGLHSFLQNTAGWNLSIDSVKVDGASEGGFALGTVQGVTIKNCDITANRYGIRLDGQLNNNAVIENNKINAFIPVVVRKASVANNLTFDGTNNFTANNTDGYWCVIGTDEYKVNGQLPTAATGKVTVVLKDTGLSLSGVYGNFGVASINNVHYLTFAEALDAVKNGETIQILDGAEGDEKATEIDFTKDIEFTITGDAPKYALPVITFQNAKVTIKDAEILIPELDARENAVINIESSTVHDAGGNSIAKSYFNGTINIDETSTVYMMQVTTMGYINVKGILNATWQTNVYGNGLINLAQGATFNTAALHLTGQDYNDRDNTDSERVGKPATIVVDGATLNVGKVKSDNGADYSYNSSKGINVGTIDGKSALLDIKNGGAVNFYMANGQTTNFGAGATVNVAASTLKTICRDENGTVTLDNNGTVNVTGASQLDVKNFTGKAINATNATLADVQFGGAVNAFGTNNISGTSTIGGILGLGYETNPTEQVVVNITGNFTGTNVVVSTNSGVDNILNVGKADGERTTVHFGQLGAFADVNVANADVTYHYAFVRNDFNATNSTIVIGNGGVNTYFSGNAKVVLDNTTWALPGFANIGSYGSYGYGNADVTLKNGSSMTATSLGIERSGDYVVKVAIDETSSLTATNLTNQGEMNIAGTVTASTQIANTGTINFTSLTAKLVTPTAGVAIKHAFEENYKIVYKDGAYSFGDFVAEINGTYYDTIQSAFGALTEGATLKFLNNVTVDEAWDCRFNGALIAVADVTIDGNGKTLKLTSDVEDMNWNTVFRVAAPNATFKNLTIDASEAEKIQRGISAQLSITVDNCKFIGNGTTSKYGVIYGEGAGDAIGSVDATVTNSTFVDNSFGVSDNRNGQDAKSVTLTGNTFTNAKVLLSAKDNVTFNDNIVNGASVVITSHNNATHVSVEANGNTLDATQANQITTNPDRVNAQDAFAKAVATNNNVYYLTLPEAIEAVAADATIKMLADVTGAGAVINKNVTIDFDGKTYTFNQAVGSTGTESNGFQILKDNTVTLKNGTLNVAESAKATFYTVIQNYANLTIENMNLDGTNLDKWSATDGDSYVLSINSGNVYIKGNTNITANNDGDKAFAFDACDMTAKGYTLPVVTVETTGTIEGLIESTATIIIKDGTFSIDVNPWCAEGLTAEPLANGYYSIVTGITIIDGQMSEFTNAEDKVVDYIRYERTFKYAEKWQALFLPFEVPVATLNDLGYEVAYLYDVHNKVVAGEEIDPSMIESVHFVKITKGTLRANHPYIIRATKNADLNLVLELQNAKLHSTAAHKMVSVESATTTTRYIFAGTYKKVNRATLTGDDNIPCLAINTGNDIEKHGGWQKMPSGANLAAFRIFMYIINKDGSPVIISDEAAQAIKIRIVGEENEDGITFIDNVENNIQDENFIYDLQGRRVLEPKKGRLYIINGKKVYYNK